MRQRHHQFWLAGSISLLCLTATNTTQAQIVPDATLGAESSIVTPNIVINGLPSDQIDGGAIQGANLFHSFQEFNVNEGRGAYFANPTGVENILSRVTGSNATKILGTLGVLGDADLFVINPNGIIFGPNASLDVRGSFVATAANAVRLGETGIFSASEPATSNLLTVNPSALFFNAVAAQEIVNQSQAEGLNGETNSVGAPVGLQVPADQTLALVGGDLVLEGGNLTALGGRIELGSVAGTGLVSLNPTTKGWVLGYDSVQNFQDIQLSGQAALDASGEGGGDIQVRGGRVTLTDGSLIFADTFGPGQGGTLAVTASESVEVVGTSADGQFPTFLGTSALGDGDAGNLTIETERLLIQGGAEVTNATSSNSTGQGGNLEVTASESVEVVGTSADGQFASFLGTNAGGNGDAGRLTIKTERLLVQDGAQVSTSTFGAGQGGTLEVTASESVKLNGGTAGFVSGLFALAQESTGSGGNLTITTEQLIVQNGAQVAVTTFNEGNAGNLTVRASDVRLIGTALSGDGLPSGNSGLFAGADIGSRGAGGNLMIEASRLIVQDGAQAQASTLGEGDAGRLIIRVSESVELIGRNSRLLAVSGLEGVFTEAQGKGGDLRIETGELIVRDGAGVTVSSTSTASDALGAGSLQVQAQTMRLENLGKLTAQTNSGQGGNITLLVQDLLLLRRNSQISTTAGIAGGGGNGGNITIDNNPFIVAVPGENSDIKANAFQGQGGKVTINADSIFGLAQRNLENLQTLLKTANPRQLDPINLPSSDITAISLTNPELSGEVTINTPSIDPSQGLVDLPEEVVNVSGLIAQGCAAGGGQRESEFIVTGRGGLPPSPSGILNSDTIWEDLRPIAKLAENRPSSESATEQTLATPGQIVEATGWVINNKGEVVLTASAPAITSHIPWLTPASCSGS